MHLLQARPRQLHHAAERLHMLLEHDRLAAPTAAHRQNGRPQIERCAALAIRTRGRVHLHVLHRIDAAHALAAEEVRLLQLLAPLLGHVHQVDVRDEDLCEIDAPQRHHRAHLQLEAVERDDGVRPAAVIGHRDAQIDARSDGVLIAVEDVERVDDHAAVHAHQLDVVGQHLVAEERAQHDQQRLDVLHVPAAGLDVVVVCENAA